MRSDKDRNNSDRYRRKKRSNHIRMVLALFFCITLSVILILFLILMFLKPDDNEIKIPFLPETEITVPEKETMKIPETETAFTPETETETDTGKELSALREEDIYTFLQGPKAWASKADWSGSWCEEVLADQEFSVFGCGLCDLANIYSTLTDCDCSPLDMYWYAQEVSDYAPVSGFGAIDWDELRDTLKSVGITSRLRRKDRSYEKFQANIAASITAIVLVCSDNDDTYWQDVEGHYVNIWLYDPDDDTVLLGDSGNPAHNRQRIPLRYLYDALKTYSDFQYLTVTEVDENGNRWGHDGINIKWKKPKYYKK